MTDKLKLDIQRVLQVFTQNEMGNKVTQFNMMGLTNMLLGVVDGTVVVQQGDPNNPNAPKPRPVETHRVELPKNDVVTEDVVTEDDKNEAPEKVSPVEMMKGENLEKV